MKKNIRSAYFFILLPLFTIGWPLTASTNTTYLLREKTLWATTVGLKETQISDKKIGDFKLSPDKELLAFNSGTFLFVFNTKNRTTTTVTDSYADGMKYPSGDRFIWAADGKSLMFARNKKVLIGIYLYNIRKGESRSLGDFSLQSIDFKLSPDKKKILHIYSQSGAPLINTLYLHHIETRKSTQLDGDYPLGVSEASFINNTEIAYLVNKTVFTDDQPNTSAKRDLYIFNLSTKKKELIPDTSIPADTKGSSAIAEKHRLKVSPNNRFISYLTNGQIFIYDRQSGKSSLSPKSLNTITDYSWGADSQTLSAIDKDGIYHITSDCKLLKTAKVSNDGIRVE